jgi:glycosyltransferase involved in cell wall biosynthesis
MDPSFGGPVEGIRQQARVWQKYGIKIEVACLDSPEQVGGYESECIIHGCGPSVLVYGASMSFIPWLRANLSRFDVVVLNGIWTFSSFGAYLVLKSSRVPYVVFTHGMLDPWFRKTYPLKHLKKWLYWPWAEYRVLRDARRVLFTCEEERLLARESFWLYSAREAVVGYGTAGPPRGQFNPDAFIEKYPNLRGKRIMLFMSRIHEKKGCDLAIEGFAKVLGKSDEWQLVIAGPDGGGLKARLIELAEELGVANKITWPGMIRDDLKWSCLETAEVFLLPSHQENFGIVVAEALASSLPVLISNKVNIWREVEQAGAGIVEEDSLEGVCRQLRKWAVFRPEDRLAMRLAARDCFERYFEIDSAVRSLGALLGEVISEAEVGRRP